MIPKYVNASHPTRCNYRKMKMPQCWCNSRIPPTGSRIFVDDKSWKVPLYCWTSAQDPLCMHNHERCPYTVELVHKTPCVCTDRHTHTCTGGIDSWLFTEEVNIQHHNCMWETLLFGSSRGSLRSTFFVNMKQQNNRFIFHNSASHWKKIQIKICQTGRSLTWDAHISEGVSIGQCAFYGDKTPPNKANMKSRYVQNMAKCFRYKMIRLLCLGRWQSTIMIISLPWGDQLIL